MSKTTPEEAKALALKHGATRYEGGGYTNLTLTSSQLAALVDEVRWVDAKPVAWVLFRRDEDGLEPIQLYGGAEKPDGEFKDRFVLRAVYFHPAPSQPAAPVELPVVAGASLLQHALKLADRLPDSEIAYTLRLYLNGLTELPDCLSDEANAAIDKELAARNYPANSANAGRAGWEAARKFKLSDAQAAITAQSQPAPPVPSSVQEIMELIYPYMRACAEASAAEIMRAQHPRVIATFAPLQAALTALVDERDRLKFELDGVNAIRSQIPEDVILHRMKYHPNIDGDGDWEIFTPDAHECADCIDVLIVRAPHGISQNRER